MGEGEMEYLLVGRWVLQAPSHKLILQIEAKVKFLPTLRNNRNNLRTLLNLGIFV
jgi:hypothetical protein